MELTNEHELYIRIKVKLKTNQNMTFEELIDRFEQECDYNIIGTDEIKVVETAYLETNINE